MAQGDDDMTVAALAEELRRSNRATAEAITELRTLDKVRTLADARREQEVSDLLARVALVEGRQAESQVIADLLTAETAARHKREGLVLTGEQQARRDSNATTQALAAKITDPGVLALIGVVVQGMGMGLFWIIKRLLA